MNMSDIVEKVVLDGKESFDKYRKIYELYAANEESFADDNYEIDLDDKFFNKFMSLKSSGQVKTKLDYGILKDLLTLQYMFYELSENNSDETLSMYRNLVLNAENIYNSLFDDQADLPLKFTIELSLKDNLAINSDKIDKYAKVFKLALKSFYNTMLLGSLTVGNGFIPLMVFHSNVAGSEKKWRERINYWVWCHSAYVDHYKKGLKRSDMIFIGSHCMAVGHKWPRPLVECRGLAHE